MSTPDAEASLLPRVIGDPLRQRAGAVFSAFAIQVVTDAETAEIRLR